MIIPLLTPILPDPSQRADVQTKPRAPSGSEAKGRRDDDRDFASVMADRQRVKRKEVRDAERSHEPRRREPVEEARRSPEKAAEKPDADTRDTAAAPAERERDADAPELVEAEPPRRQVTIPELPAKLQPAAQSGETDAKGDVDPRIAMEGATLALATPSDIDPAAQQISAEGASEGAPTAASDTSSRAAATLLRAAEPSGLPKAPLAPDAGRIVVPQGADAELSPVSGTAGEIEADGILRRHDLQPTAAEAAARALSSAQIAQQVTQSARARDLAQAGAQSAADERRAARSLEPVARSSEAAAATLVPQANAHATAAQTTGAVQMAMLQPATREALAAREKSASAFALEGEAESLRFDMRGGTSATQTHQASFAAPVARGDMGRHVAMQIADFARNMPDRPVDVSLSPEELGRVRLSISTGEGGVTLQVLAERPETLDLMRRHADQLARELADLGFASIDLSFGQGRDPENGNGDGKNATPGGGTATAADDTGVIAAEDTAQNRLTLTESGGLDIRI